MERKNSKGKHVAKLKYTKEKHPDEKEDKVLIKKMVKKTSLK